MQLSDDLDVLGSRFRHTNILTHCLDNSACKEVRWYLVSRAGGDPSQARSYVSSSRLDIRKLMPKYLLLLLVFAHTNLDVQIY